MKIILITQELKDRNKLFRNREVGSYYTGIIPNKFWGLERIIGGYAERTDLHKKDGWYDLVTPQPAENEKLGRRYFDAENEVYTYHLIPKTEEDLKQEKVSNSQMKRGELLREIQENKVIEEMQAVTDENKLLEVSDLFPIWGEGMDLKVDEKIQGFLDGELVLFKVIQAHITQLGWEPENTPALFTRVGYEGEVLEWVQPTGAQDAYNTGDRVLFEGNTYESLIDANTYSPTAYPAGWQIV